MEKSHELPHPAVANLLDTARQVFGDQVSQVEVDSEPAPDGVGAAASPKLEECTHDPVPVAVPSIPHPRPYIIPHEAPFGAAYDEISVTTFRDGSGEFRVIKRPGWYNPYHKREHKRKVKQEQRATMDPEVAKRSAFRAKKNARCAAIQLLSSHMLTFTFVEDHVHPEIAEAVWKDFVIRYRNLCPYTFKLKGRYPHKVADFEYVLIPEYQQRGSIHFHVLTNCAHDIAMVRDIFGDCCEKHGLSRPSQINAKYYQTRKHRMNAINYAVKYLTKGFEQGAMWAKRYWRSKGIPPPKYERFFTLDDLSEDQARSLIAGDYQARVVWLRVVRVGPFDCIVGKFVPT